MFSSVSELWMVFFQVKLSDFWRLLINSDFDVKFLILQMSNFYKITGQPEIVK